MKHFILIALTLLSTLTAFSNDQIEDVITVIGVRPPSDPCAHCISYDEFIINYGPDAWNDLGLAGFENFLIEIQPVDSNNVIDQCHADQEELAQKHVDLRSLNSRILGTEISLANLQDEYDNLLAIFNETYDAGLIMPMQWASEQIQTYEISLGIMRSQRSSTIRRINELEVLVEGCPDPA